MKPGATYITTSSGIRPLLVANELIFAPAETRLAKLINDFKGNAYFLHSYSLIYSRKEANLIEFRPTTTAINEIALADDYKFTGMIHVNNDGPLTVNTESLERINGATNIIHGMGHVLVIPIKPGFVDKQPRRRRKISSRPSATVFILRCPSSGSYDS